MMLNANDVTHTLQKQEAKNREKKDKSKAAVSEWRKRDRADQKGGKAAFFLKKGTTITLSQISMQICWVTSRMGGWLAWIGW
jgi:hypothetical protein